ncbi:DUF4317 domain-containing protein [Clostridium sp.]|uniref:DUF4317 domain-containing protein n=1 Tax=Clostridium sp. TaxID=1506 RepID=UPI00261D6CC0|nr:DUF4317 domain-containing protein [Clostridium sp.]
MQKKDILELKKRLKKDYCTFTKMCGCYVNGEKNTILKFRETFLNLEEDEYFKYLEIAKKVMSGTIGNNILELNFPLNEFSVNEKQVSLVKLKNSKLKDDTILDEFYNSVIENYDYTGNFLILLFHDAYDVITKTKDNLKVDESEEVYEYILCAICPVSLSKPGLRYFEEENSIKARIRDWVVENPSNGFVFPAFINRSTDINSVMYYTKNTKDTHPELMENILGCPEKQTATIQKQTFKSIIKDSFVNEEKAEKVFMEVQESLNNMVEEHNSMYEDTLEEEPMLLTNKDVENILIENGVTEDVAKQIEKNYSENFNEDVPLAESLIDKKVLKANEQRKKEERLEKQVQVLKARIEEFEQETSLNSENTEELSIDENGEIIEDIIIDEDTEILEEALEEVLEEELQANNNYDVVLHVKPEKISQVKSQIIDGKKCIIIPIEEDEQATVNGIDDLI